MCVLNDRDRRAETVARVARKDDDGEGVPAGHAHVLMDIIMQMFLKTAERKLKPVQE